MSTSGQPRSGCRMRVNADRQNPTSPWSHRSRNSGLRAVRSWRGPSTTQTEERPVPTATHIVMTGAGLEAAQDLLRRSPEAPLVVLARADSATPGPRSPRPAGRGRRRCSGPAPTHVPPRCGPEGGRTPPASSAASTWSTSGRADSPPASTSWPTARAWCEHVDAVADARRGASARHLPARWRRRAGANRRTGPLGVPLHHRRLRSRVRARRHRPTVTRSPCASGEWLRPGRGAAHGRRA